MVRIALAVCSVALALAAAVAAAGPANNVSAARHPNIAAAQRAATEAYNHIVAAQKANEFDLGGHAQKAKELLDEVNRELKEAAEASNAHGH
ncbi:MAG TPA: hypothetical protein VFB32_17660 [Rudaea sp.]|nr:hypothetical protein [Rudaea sp.]